MLAALVGLTSVNALAYQHIRHAQARDRAAAAAFRVNDQVHLTHSAASANLVDVGGRTVVVSVALSDVDASLDLTRLQLTGKGLRTVSAMPTQPELSSGELALSVPIDCTAAAKGSYLTGVVLSLDVVPLSKRTHRLAFPVSNSDLAHATWDACDLPDPTNRSTAELDVQHDQLTLQVDPIPHASIPLVITALSAPGFQLSLYGVRTPHALRPDVGELFDVDVKVTSCFAAMQFLSFAQHQDGPHLNLAITDTFGAQLLRVGQGKAAIGDVQSFLDGQVDVRC